MLGPSGRTFVTSAALHQLQSLQHAHRALYSADHILHHANHTLCTMNHTLDCKMCTLHFVRCTFEALGAFAVRTRVKLRLRIEGASAHRLLR